MKPMRIFCAKCEREVDSFAWWNDYENDTRILAARCHGDSDQMELAPDELFALERVAPVVGVAFAQRLGIPYKPAVAQWTEQGSSIPTVEGSNPSRRANTSEGE